MIVGSLICFPGCFTIVHRSFASSASQNGTRYRSRTRGPLKRRNVIRTSFAYRFSIDDYESYWRTAANRIFLPNIHIVWSIKVYLLSILKSHVYDNGYKTFNSKTNKKFSKYWYDIYMNYICIENTNPSPQFKIPFKNFNFEDLEESYLQALLDYYFVVGDSAVGFLRGSK